MIRGCTILGSQVKYFFSIYSHLKSSSKNTSESCTQNSVFKQHFLLLNIAILFFSFPHGFAEVPNAFTVNSKEI